MYKIAAKNTEIENDMYGIVDSAHTLKDAKDLVEKYKKQYGKSWDVIFYKS